MLVSLERKCNMGKYKFFGNKLTKGPKGEEHPSIDLGIKGKRWENIEVTSSPSLNDKYTKFDDNPNPKWRGNNKDGTPKKPSYFRRYVRKDSKYARLGEYKNYSLTENDEKKVDCYLEERKKNIELDKQRRETAIKRKQQKNDAKLRYHQGGRSASRRNCAQASSDKLNQKPSNKSRK